MKKHKSGGFETKHAIGKLFRSGLFLALLIDVYIKNTEAAEVFPGSNSGSQAQAIKRFPEIGVAGSEANKRFLSAVEEARKSRPDIFKSADWPLTIAGESESLSSLSRALAVGDFGIIQSEAIDFKCIEKNTERKINELGVKLKVSRQNFVTHEKSWQTISLTVTKLFKNAQTSESYVPFKSDDKSHLSRAENYRKQAEELLIKFKETRLRLKAEEVRLSDEIGEVVSAAVLEKKNSSSLVQTEQKPQSKLDLPIRKKVNPIIMQEGEGQPNQGTANAISEGSKPQESNSSSNQAEKKQEIRLLWSHKLAEEMFTRPLIYKNIILISDSTGMHSFNAETGKKIWTFDTHSPPIISYVSSNRVLFKTLKDVCFCVSIESGQRLWQRELEETSYSSDHYDHKGFFGSDNVIGVGSRDTWFGLDPNSGAIMWRRARDKNEEFYPRSVEGEFLMTDNASLRRISERTGGTLGSEQLILPGSHVACVINQQIYYVQYGGGLLPGPGSNICVSRIGSEKTLWRKQFNFPNHQIQVMDSWNESIFVKMKYEEIARFDHAGDVIWKKGFNGKYLGPCCVSDGALFCLYNGALVAVRCQDGMEIARFESSEKLSGNYMSVGNGVIAVKNNSLNALSVFKLF
jgi:outer membrane protein assembly factor BamB